MRLIAALAFSLAVLATTVTERALAADGPVAAYGFDAGSGSLAADQSGQGNTGTLVNATWAGTGRFGNSLEFNGTDAFVTVADSNSLDLATGMTVEGWVRPSGAGGYRTLLVKEQPMNLVYGLYANSDGNRPESQVAVGSPRVLDGTAPVANDVWTHLAATYDGATQRLHVNGTQVATLAVAGTISASSSPLKIGGNAIWGEFFEGLIDEVRVYDRALTPAEIQADMTTPIGAPDTTPPSAPGTLTATGGSGQVGLSWGAATDNMGVARYAVHRSTSPSFTPTAANRIAQPTATTYTDAGLAAGTYHYKVIAEDGSGNTGPASNEAAATVTAPTGPPAGLVAAYSMDQGAGTTLPDLSGGGNTGTISGATWSPGGRFGSALSFNGSGNLVTVGDANALDLTTGMTLEAWVNPSTLGNSWRTILMKERPGGLVYNLYAHGGSGTKAPTVELLIGADRTLKAANPVPTNAWSHIAASYDASAIRIYVNGTQVAQQVQTGAISTSTGALRIGGNSVWGEYFAGAIDEVRVYNRALSAAEIQGDMNRAVGPQDTQAPTAPASLAATGTVSAAQLSWSASTDNVGVARYNVHRSTTAGFTPSAANRIAQPTGTTYTDTPAAGTYYYRVTAEDGAGNVSTPSNESSAQVGDTLAPGAPGTLTAAGALGRATLNWGAATDNVGVVRYAVHRSTTSGFTPSAANRIAQPTGTSHMDTTAAGTYYYRVAAEDAAGNVGPVSNEASATVTADTQAPTAPGTLAASAASSTINLTWAAATDNVAVARYNLHRSTTAGFTPSAANRIAQPTATSYSDAGLAPGTYYYRVTAEDGAANVGPPSNQTSAAATPPPPPSGLVAAYGFDESSGTTTADQSGNGNTGTLAGAVRSTSGRFGNALSFGGAATVNIASSASLNLSSAMTLEAWVRPTTLNGYSTVMMRERPGYYAQALYANTDGNRPSANAFTSGDHELRGSAAIPAATWSHLAATYNGTALVLYVNGAQVASQPATGALIATSGLLRIGGNAIWGEHFNGLIDEARVYNRALTAAEIQADMNRSVTPDATAPTVTARTPAGGADGINVGTAPTATFSEAMLASSISASTFVLKHSSGATVPATVTYDAQTTTATLTPVGALQYGATYNVTVAGASDLAGNPLASDVTWSFTTEASPPEILVVGSTANRFGSYLGEILRNEGLHAFTTIDVGFLSADLLNTFDVVLLGDTPLTASQVAMLTNWANGGGNLVAMRPDKQLAGLLGLTDAGTTLGNAYLRVDATQSPGTGIVDTTIQYHGTADRYTLNGARAVATLYSTATAATTSPAVTLRNVGGAGGQAAAFTFDLARSVVYTRQGNPGWAGQERDGIVGVRPNDMFFGARAGDVQPDWLDTTRIAIPQADEQQRLLANLITQMERDRMPLPRFWYLPRGEKAAVVMSGDDHSPAQAIGGTASHFDRYKALSPPGCSVAAWECVRSSSYVYPGSVLTNAQATGYVADGFEVGLHLNVGSCPSTVPSNAAVTAALDTQLTQLSAQYTGVPAPATLRSHCVAWPDWASMAKLELARGIRLDANYYHYPASWIGARPGFLNGGGFPMRFADLDGAPIDVYQQNTNMNDEAGQAYPSTVTALLDNAVGANGYYGAFGANMHTDAPAPHSGAEAIVAAAQARGVPVVSHKQMLDWVDGRNASTIRGMSWNAPTFTFVTTVGPGANGLQTLLPTQGPSGTLSALSCGGSPRSYTVQTIKGVPYATFDTITGTCQATYS